MKTRRGPSGRGGSRKSRNESRPVLERVEDRLLLTTFVVNNTADAGAGSLRDAITLSNGSTTALPNVISFGGLPGGLNTIAILSPLPQVTTSVTIDGTTAPGYVPAIHQPIVQVDGSKAGAGTLFDVAASKAVIRALNIDNFSGAAITLTSGTGDVVSGCYIGTDRAGTTAGINTGIGIINKTAAATIGGTTADQRNVITAVGTAVQFAAGSGTGSILGNYIGTNSSGTARLGTNNAANGVELDSLTNVVSGNLISGYGYGIQILNNANGNKVTGNLIGTDFTGNAKIPNTFDGIYINNSTSTTIGGSTAGAANVISGNTRDGIQVTGNSPFTTIQGNLIGIGADKSTQVGNGFNGILFNGGGGFSTIGGADLFGSPTHVADEAAKGNTIAFNGGLSSLSSPAAGVLITGNQAIFDGVLSNSIYSNAGLGIQINGANQGVVPPTVDSALSGGGQTRINGSLFEQQPGTYRVQVFSSISPNPSGIGDGQTFLGDFDVTTDSAGNAAINVTLPGMAGIGSYIAATATQGATTINNSSQFSRAVAVGQAVVADLAVTVGPTATDPATPLVGQPYVFSVTVTNIAGNNDATGVVLTDTLPANSTLDTAGSTPGGTLLNGVLTYDVGNLASGASATFLVSARPSTTTGTFTDTATVTGPNIDPNLNNNTASFTPANGVQPDAALRAILTPAANPSPVGAPLTYVLTVSNQGPSTANNAVATVTFDPSFTNIVVSPDQGTYTISGNVVTINSGIVPSGSGSTITLTATPTRTGSFTTTASISSSLINPDTGTMTSKPVSVAVAIANAADLGIALSSPASVLTGQSLLYSAVVTNFGPSTATAPVVVDVLPKGVTFDPSKSSDSNGGTLALVNGVVVATLKPLASGGTDTVTIAVTPTGSGSLSNTVSVADPNATNPAEIDTNPANNTATTTTLVSPADLSVKIVNPADPLFIGTQATYQVQVTNNGPADATGVLLTDRFGPGAVIVSSTAGVISTDSGGGVVTASLGNLPAGATTTVTIIVNPILSGPLAEAATVASDQLDPNPNNNAASVSNLVNPVDLAVTVVGSPATVLVGDPVTFLVTVTNNGPATATNVLFNNILPAGSTFVSAVASQGRVASSSGAVTGNLGTLASGASATVAIVVTPTAVVTSVDTASVNSDDYDTNQANNTGSGSVAVANQPGTIDLATPLTIVGENGGSVTIALNRTKGSLGAVTVDYATFDGSARAGVNYVATTGTVSFADGQASATITIPVIDDGIVNASTGFYVRLLGTTGGAIVGPNNVTAVLVANTDRDTTPPVITGFSAIPNGSSLNGFVVQFDKALDVSRASLTSNYHVFLSNRDAGKGGDVPIALAAANYNPANNTVTLVPTGVLPGNRFYHVVINGSYGQALTDISGNVLFGSGGRNTNYEIYYGWGNSLRYIDSQANLVTINVGGPGTLEVIRSTTGDASTVGLTGVVAHKTKLSGAVKKLGNSSSGHTTIGTITGLGRFGDVNSSLTTPGFYVFVPPTFARSTTTTGTVTTVSPPTISAAVKVVKHGPRGPLAR